MPRDPPTPLPTTIDTAARVFTAVLIPHDASRPLSEVDVPQPANEALAAMFNFAKAHFTATHSNKLTPQGHQQLLTQLQQQAPNAPSAAFASILTQPMCDVVPLVPNTREFGYVGWNLVVDDKAKAKGLPSNPRASALASACGLSIDVVGDAFLVKQFDDDAGFLRLDVSVADLSSTAEWVQRVRSRRLSRPSSSSSTSAPATATFTSLKTMGNSLFSSKKYQDALTCYTSAKEKATTAEERAVIESNLSSTYLALGDFASALRSADEAILAKPTWAKAYARRGDALVALHSPPREAHEAYTQALQLAQTDSSASPTFISDMQARLSSLQVNLQG